MTLAITVKRFPKKSLRTRSKKLKPFFSRKENVPKVMEDVRKWNDLEQILLPLERVVDRSKMERSRTYSGDFETLSIYFETFSLLSNNLHLWACS